MSERWSLGVLIGLPLLVVVVLVLAGLAVVLFTSPPEDDLRILSWLPAVVALAIILIAGFAYWPWSAAYHKWLPVHGTVTDVSSRILSDGDNGINQRFVVVINGQQYGCDDTRCSLVKPGHVLDLSCKREFQYAGTSGWACNFIRDESLPGGGQP